MPSQNDRAIYSLARAGGYMPPPWARGGYSSYGDYGDGTLGGLIGRQGAIEAQGYSAGANTLAQGIQQAAGVAADYFKERDQKKEMAKRDAATLAAVQGWDGKDPMALYQTMLSVRGPQDAMQYTNQVLSLRGGPKKDPAAELGRVGTSAQFFLKLPPEMQAASWPAFRQSLGPSLGNLGIAELPEQWDPQNRPVVEAIGSSFGPKQEKQKPFAVGGAVYDPETQQFHAPPEKAPEGKLVETVDERGRPISKMATAAELAKGVPKYVPPKEPREPREEQLVQVDVGGVPTWVPKSEAAGRPAAQAPRAVTGAERGALAFYNRGRKALDDIAPLEESIRGKNLASQARLEFAPNWLQSTENQQYRQAQRAFTEARLRKESGAAIPDKEYSNDAKTYFAQPGDTAEVLEQKRIAREEVLQGLGFASGKAYQEYYGEPLATPARGGSRGGGETPRVSSPADYAKLPSGAIYVDPSGKRRRKR